MMQGMSQKILSYAGYNLPLPIAGFQHSLTDGVDRSLIDCDINVGHVLTVMSVLLSRIGSMWS